MERKIINNYLDKIKTVIEQGKYKDNWGSLSEYPIPKWYKDAKFGIFIHWGVYSVPAFGNEWYPRRMYLQGSEEFEHHRKTYGPHKDFGYKDFIPMFKAEKFDPEQWAALFKKSGAQYIMPVAEHHDGFQMYDSEVSDWNSAKMGPMRDVLAELKTSVEKQDLVFAASSHRAENFWFFGGCRDFDSGLQDITLQEPYGYADPMYKADDTSGTSDITSRPASKEHLENWLVRSCELVDKYQPKVVWFDWWIQNMSFKPYLKQFAAYYYNRSLEWDYEVAINYKDDAYAYSTAVFDIERGQLSSIRPEFWQTDTAIAKNSWGFTNNNDFKQPQEIVCDFVDIVSKNGCLLLNVGPKSDGLIPDEEISVLEAIGSWLEINGAGIYGTTHWKVFGEGPTEVVEGTFMELKRKGFTSEDIRFTYKAPYLYAFILKWPKSNQVRIKALAAESRLFKGFIESIELLGFDQKVNFSRGKDSLKISCTQNIDTGFPVCLQIKLD